MNREQILESMIKGAEKLECDDLSADQRGKYQARYNELETMLNNLEDTEKETQETPVNEYPQHIKIHIDKIRETLGMKR